MPDYRAEEAGRRAVVIRVGWEGCKPARRCRAAEGDAGRTVTQRCSRQLSKSPTLRTPKWQSRAVTRTARASACR